jgi:hypothetical protein
MRATDFRYQVVPGKKLSQTQHRDIDRLLWESLHLDFPDRSPYELASFLVQSAIYRDNPNRAVGGRNLRSGQAYARGRLVLAIDSEDELAAAVPFADNASARSNKNLPPVLDRALQTAEREAKLYAPFGNLRGKPLIQSRWGWFGQPAFSPEVRAGYREAEPSEFTVVHGLIAAVSQRANQRQPSSAYTFGEESFWQEQLDSAGFEERGEELTEPFDSDFQTRLVRWTAPSFGHIREQLLLKNGAENALPHIRAQVMSNNS